MDEKTVENILSAKGIIVGGILMMVGFWVKSATIMFIGEFLILLVFILRL